MASCSTPRQYLKMLDVNLQFAQALRHMENMPDNWQATFNLDRQAQIEQFEALALDLFSANSYEDVVDSPDRISPMERLLWTFPKHCFPKTILNGWQRICGWSHHEINNPAAASSTERDRSNEKISLELCGRYLHIIGTAGINTCN